MYPLLHSHVCKTSVSGMIPYLGNTAAVNEMKTLPSGACVLVKGQSKWVHLTLIEIKCHFSQ